MSGFYDLPFFPIGPSDGVSGKDGVSPTISVEDISGGHRLIIVDATGRRTVDILDGIVGPQGEPGIPGGAGKDGAAGKDGLGVKSLAVNNLGELIITYTDNANVNLGKIVGATGPQGEPGNDGQSGKDGANGKSAYEYAKDGGYTGTETEFIELLTNTVDKRNITLGLHTDGLLYLFINGEPVGTGISQSTSTET